MSVPGKLETVYQLTWCNADGDVETTACNAKSCNTIKDFIYFVSEKIGFNPTLCHAFSFSPQGPVVSVPANVVVASPPLYIRQEGCRHFECDPFFFQDLFLLNWPEGSCVHCRRD